jgi:hypothetical protein
MINTDRIRLAWLNRYSSIHAQQDKERQKNQILDMLWGIRDHFTWHKFLYKLGYVSLGSDKKLEYFQRGNVIIGTVKKLENKQHRDILNKNILDVMDEEGLDPFEFFMKFGNYAAFEQWEK